MTTHLPQFRCAPLGAWLTPGACADRWQRADVSPRERASNILGHVGKSNARLAAGPCDGCALGSLHAKGELPDTLGGERIIRRVYDASGVAPSAHAKRAPSPAFQIAPSKRTVAATCRACGGSYERSTRATQRWCSAACRDAARGQREQARRAAR